MISFLLRWMRGVTISIEVSGFVPSSMTGLSVVRGKPSPGSQNQVISNTGFESPCSTKGESFRFSPLETPSALCSHQEAGFTLNQGDTLLNTCRFLWSTIECFNASPSSINKAGGQAFNVLICIKHSQCRVTHCLKCLFSFDRSRSCRTPLLILLTSLPKDK